MSTTTKANVKASDLRAGDRIWLRGGPYRGHRVEIVQIRPGRYGAYSVEARLLGNVETAVDYAETFNVERPDTEQER